MSPARIPRIRSLAFIPLLSPPLRVSLRSLQWLNRSPLPSSRPVPVQRRSVHLYKTAKTRTIHGMHKIIPFSLYTPPPPSESAHRINLWKDKSEELIAKDITLEELYNDHLKPGKLLYLREPPTKSLATTIEKQQELGVPQKHNNYGLVDALSIRGIHINVTPPKVLKLDNPLFKQLAMLKEIHLQLASPAAYTKMQMDKAYRFLMSACPVEVAIRFAGAKVAKKDKLEPGPSDRWPWMNNHWAHLRPDFIMKSMPKGAYYMIEPFSDGRHVQWVMAMPTEQQMNAENLTKRLLKVKKAVARNIDQGMQAELPMPMRQGLIKAGNNEYSVETGAPRRSDYAQRVVQKLSQAPAPKGKWKGITAITWGDGSEETLEGSDEKRVEDVDEKRVESSDEKRVEGSDEKRVEGSDEKRVEDRDEKRARLRQREAELARRYMPKVEEKPDRVAFMVKRAFNKAKISNEKVYEREYQPPRMFQRPAWHSTADDALAAEEKSMGFRDGRRETGQRKTNFGMRSDFTERRTNFAKTRPEFTDRRSNFSETRLDFTRTRSNFTDRGSNGTDRRSNGTDRRSNGADRRSNFTETRPDFTDRRSNFTDRRSNFTDRRSNSRETTPDFTRTRPDFTMRPGLNKPGAKSYGPMQDRRRATPSITYRK
ncbi:hypothetical protein CC80DRAFT_495621 [Byssothecium circinans]|uniref:Uncharacterized protein n=1 Tax=Byssothecium circinans TaxID=147558 RepID=A0A6A5TJX9_9PLEO|nr:hypothetical protein CC80DRAFT_495621 [Byssothecium circinans]